MEFVTVRRCFNPAEAHLIAGQLQAAGLSAYVRDEAAALSIDGYALSVGGIRVQVPAQEAADAELLLSAPEATPIE
jgi:hypothetical protein